MTKNPSSKIIMCLIMHHLSRVETLGRSASELFDRLCYIQGQNPRYYCWLVVDSFFYETTDTYSCAKITEYRQASSNLFGDHHVLLCYAGHSHTFVLHQVTQHLNTEVHKVVYSHWTGIVDWTG